MNDNPNDNAPDPEEIEVSTIGQPNEVGVVHTFKGKILRPYSFADRSLMGRMLLHGDMGGVEFIATFLWILHLNPKEVSSIRGEEVEKAFLRVEQWADEVGIHSSPEVVEEASAVFKAITKSESEANNWEVAPERKGNLPPVPTQGNA